MDLSDIQHKSRKRKRADSHQIHKLSNVQHIPSACEPAYQDERHIQHLLDRSISTALTIAGYDTVTKSALDSFRTLTEEFMRNFLDIVSLSMVSSRRTTPIPQDFVQALSELDYAPSDLQRHLRYPIPHSVSCPALQPPNPARREFPDLDRVLGQDLCIPIQSYFPHIPSHFPALPSAHTWRITPHTTLRESDPRKLRELAAQEGVLAEKALRNLATSANKQTSNGEQNHNKKISQREILWREALAAVMPSNTDSSMANDVIDATTTSAKSDSDRMEQRLTMVVNSDRIHWRKGTVFTASAKS